MLEKLEIKVLEIAFENCHEEDGKLEFIKKQLDLAWDYAKANNKLLKERKLVVTEQMKSQMTPDQIKRFYPSSLEFQSTDK